VIRDVLESDGLQGWASLPVGAYIAEAMIDAPGTALPLLAAMTSRFSAEFAIRPFFDAHYALTMRHLAEWVTHPDEHVRRLVSEGSRPRLPWAPRLRRFMDDPSPTLELLDRLRDDPSEYVRRSVANHLNDIAKDHPERAVAVARRWAADATDGGFVVRHGLRTLVKAGHPDALALLGFDPDAAIQVVALSCSPRAIAIGGAVSLSVTLRSPTATRAAIDYVVHYQGAKGLKAGKVFKLAVCDLPQDRPVTLERRHSFAHVSIRRIHPGPHRLEIQVNGRVLAGVEIDVT
jgi:3-methyladenine DNA glycosylase AlkC